MKSIIDIGETCDLIERSVVVIDSQGVIYYINNTAEKYFITEREYACGKKYSDIIKVMDRSGLNKLALFDKSGNAIDCGNGVILVGGKIEYYVQYKAKPYQASGSSVIYWLFVFENISKEVELRQQLKHKRRLEVLGDLAAGVAHDINNTLGSIEGCAEILSSELLQNERLNKLSKSIITSVNSAAGLSKKLLRFSTPSETVFELINIHDLLNETIDVLRCSIDERITINTEYIDEEVIVYADRSELEIVLFNIALNAQEALVDGGIISLRTDIIDNTQKQLKIPNFELNASHYLKIAITDNGGGIAESLLEKLFDQNFTTKALNNGEGFGLFTVYNIMKHLGGAVEVSSELGVESQFNLLLPLAKSSSNHNEKNSADILLDVLVPEEEQEKKFVLLIDDNDMVRLSMHEVLVSLNYEVIEAENGEEGVRLFKENSAKLDLVILDVIMPVMDGREALIEIRNINKDIHVIVASGYMNQLSQSVFMELGANAYLAKPFKVEELISVINSLDCVEDLPEQSDVNLLADISMGSSLLHENDTDIEVVRKGFSDVNALMLIEGNENIRELMHEVLLESGFNVTAFEDIEHAKKVILDGMYFSLSIIDIDFTDQHDAEIFSLLKNNDDNLPRYIIASSSKDVDGVALRALKLGVDDFLVKPFSLNFMKIRLEVARRYIENEQMKNRMQTMLRENQERMALAIEGAGIGMWDWNILEKEFFASDKCKELFGYIEGTKTGVLDYLHSITFKEDQERIAKEFSQYLRNPVGILNIEFRISHTTKGDVWILSIAKLFGDKERGRAKRLIGISMDITERKREEHVLREESQRLEEMVLQRTAELININDKLSKEIEAREIAELKNMEHQLKLMDADKLTSLGILVAGIGHEINNPIQFIMFNLPFLKSAWDSVLPIIDEYYETHPDFEVRGIPYELARDRLPNMVNDVIEGAERISSIVKELREYSRQSRIEEFKEEDIVEVVLSAKSLFSKFMGPNANDIGLHTPSEHVITIINKTRIEQVIINLLQNASFAVKHTERKEILINLKYSEDKKWVEIEVKDTGAGIKKEHMKHLTDPFFTTRSGDGGSGLGLAMCNRIVHDHSGEILFDSEEGVGTTVKVVLPVK